MKVRVISLLLFSAFSAQARLGETSIQCDDRYGPARMDQATTSFEKMFPLLDGAIQRTFNFGGWQIRAAFLELDGPAVCIQYQKLPSAGSDPMVKDYEMASILKGETPQGMTWTHVTYANPNSANTGLAKAFEGMLSAGVGAQAWLRTDGATARLLPGGMIVRIELPVARAYEDSLKIAKEQKARASVPQF